MSARSTLAAIICCCSRSPAARLENAVLRGSTAWIIASSGPRRCAATQSPTAGSSEASLAR